MKTTYKIKFFALVTATLSLFILAGLLGSCKKGLLDEASLSNPSTAQILASKGGFKTYITALHDAARNELFSTDTYTRAFDMQTGTDVATTGDPALNVWLNYVTTLTPTNGTVSFYWNWAYSEMIARANTIIMYANKSNPSIWTNEAEKNAIIAEARFFRGYSYNLLANLFGGVPIVDTVFDTPKVDFVRSTRQQVLEFAKKDLVYASSWLPTTVAKIDEGRIVKAAADHLLSEVYISLGDYDNAILSASAVISSGLYNLMTTRFGSEAANPGDVYSDLFRDNNQNRSSGNRESIYVLQIEDVTPGGTGSGVGANSSIGTGNNWVRAWGPRYFAITDPAGKSGMIVCDSMGRGVGWLRPTSYVLYNIWQNNFTNDLRNSRFNIRRQFTYNNPASAYFGQVVGKRTTSVDTMQFLFPVIRKIEGKVGKTTNNTAGKTFKDVMVFRLAETYLLRAEAYIRKGAAFNPNAAADINVVRNRANATPVAPGNVSIDYLLDERARELIVEEPRRRTLARMGKLVERVRLYNMRSETRSTIQDYHQWFPLPQSAIDANFGAILEQNPGY
jgi:starch-binding outer membrane protein, SusD/RagB family